MPHVNNNAPARNENLVGDEKPGLEGTINGLGKLFRKSNLKNEKKTVKIKVNLPHVNKKPPD